MASLSGATYINLLGPCAIPDRLTWHESQGDVHLDAGAPA